MDGEDEAATVAYFASISCYIRRILCLDRGTMRRLNAICWIFVLVVATGVPTNSERLATIQ